MRRLFGAMTVLLLGACVGRSRATAREAIAENPVGAEPPRRQRELVRLPPLRVERFEFTPFPEEPPIQGADPAARRVEILRLPGALRVERQADERSRPVIAYGVDERRLEDVALEVGYKMVVGCDIEWTVRQGDAAPEWISSWQGGIEGGTGFWYGPEERGVAPSAWVFEAAIEVFETGHPPAALLGADRRAVPGALAADALRAAAGVTPMAAPKTPRGSPRPRHPLDCTS